MKLQVARFSEKLYDLEVPEIDLLSGAEIFIGRADDCHIVLDDQQVSRRHAKIFFESGHVTIEKLSDLGAVAINGKEIESARLSEGDKVSITDFELLFEEVPSEGQVAQAANGPEASDDRFPSMEYQASEEATAIVDTLEEAPRRQDELEHSDTFSEISSEEQDEVLESSPIENHEEGPGFSSDAGDDDLSTFDGPSSLEGGVYEGNEAFGEEEGFGEEESFGEGGFGEGEVSGFGEADAGESTQVFSNFAKYYLEIDGEKAPFDRYTIEDKEVFIGRDPEKCQICLNDPEVSSVHAVIRKTLVNCYIEDLDSSNGTIFNGERVNKAELTNNDNFQIGETIFTTKIVSELLQEEGDRLMPVEEGQEVEVEEIVEEEVDYGDMVPGDDEYSMEEVKEKSIIKRILKDPKKKRMLIYGTVGLLLLALFGVEDRPSMVDAPTEKNKSEKSAKAAGEEQKETPKANKKNLSPEVLAKLEENYALALAKYEAGEYYEARQYLDVIRGIDPEFKDTPTLIKLVKEGTDELLRIKAEEEEEKERKIRQIKINALLEKTKKAVSERQVAVAESLFGQILELDPENMDVPQLKLELDAYKAEQERIKEEAARKKALRKAMVDALQPGKTLYLKEEWYKAIEKLEKFTKKKGMDEDLVKEATNMLIDSRKSLSAQINPLLGRARSFKEGQDLKRAYESYGEVLKYEPTNEEALVEREKIHEELRARSMRIYREALIAESLSLFDEAREKFEEVQQISPINSEYYLKASERLKNYLE